MRNRLRLHTAQHRRAAALPAVAMRHLAHQVFITTLAMRKNRTKIALRAGGNKQRCFKTQKRCNLFLEAIYRRVIAKHIITHRRSQHGFAHCGCGAGDGVAAQIDG